MITLRQTVDGSESRVIFSPRPGTSNGTKEIQRQLIYGYRCPFCRNPILFAFLTEEKVHLKKFEETRMINGLQEFHGLVPGQNSIHETAYRSEFMRVKGHSMGVQRVAMVNHIIPENKIGKQHVKEHGPSCCPYTAVFSMRKDLLIKDAILMGGFPERELGEYNLPDWAAFMALVGDGRESRMFPIEGMNAPPLMAVRSDYVEDRKGMSIWRGLLLPFKKSKQQEAAEVQAELAPEEDELENDSDEDGLWEGESEEVESAI